MSLIPYPNRTAAQRIAWVALAAASLWVSTSAFGQERIGDADGNGIFDRQDVMFVRAYLAAEHQEPAQPNLRSDVATPCGVLDASDLFLLDRAARQAEQGAGRSTPVDSQCHGGPVGGTPPDPHAGAEAILDLDDVFAIIADEIPPFAGLYFGEGGPTVALTDPSAAVLAAAEDAVIDHFGAERFAEEPTFRAAEVDFGFAALHEARHGARELLSAPEITDLDIDEVGNRLVVGIRNAADRAYVENLLSGAGIPLEMVVTVVDTYRPQSDLLATIRPIRAGRQVREENWMRCTLGAVVDRFGVRGWLTNAHCTPQFGVDNNIAIAQSWDELAGIEGHDPFFGPNLDYSQCNGNPCRWSDSVFMDANRMATSSLGMVDESPGTHRFFTSMLLNPLKGEAVCVTGKNSGTQCGEITATCTDRHVEDAGKNWDYHLFCQMRTDIDTVAGDSGAPVYQQQGFDGAALVGLHQGEGDLTGEEFSPVSGLLKDLGPIEPLVGDAAPEVTITQPAAGSNVGPGNPFTLTLEADFWDEEEGDECGQCIVYWSSDVDGSLGSSVPIAGKTSITVTLWGEGKRTIKAVGHDGGSAPGEDSVTVTTDNTPPQVWIDWPPSGFTVWRNAPYIFQSSSFDSESFAPLDCSALSWESNGVTLGSGCFPSLTFSTLGYTMVELVGTDPGNASDTALILVHVVDPLPASPPLAEILAPAPNILHPLDALLEIEVWGDDPDDASPLVYEWILKGPGMQPTTLHTSPATDGEVKSFSFVPEDHLYVPCGGRPIELEIQVTDPDNMVGSKTIGITVGRPC